MKRYNILIVDDEEKNRALLASIFSIYSKFNIMLAPDGKTLIEMLESLKETIPDIILLDVMMPLMDGFEVAKKLKNNSIYKDIPIIFITALAETENLVKGFISGGVDYITKPFNSDELIARVNVHLQLKGLHDDFKRNEITHNEFEEHLLNIVQKKTEKLENLTIAMVSALENANLFNDTDTGNHIKRVSEYSQLLASAWGCKSDFIKRIRLYAPLHDVGKVGISDAVLKKPGRYTEEEYEKMKQHVVFGGRMLDHPEIDIMAKNIALYHHEKWDGKGYVNAKKGNEIPLESQIIALADVFDALTTKRIYKDAYNVNEVKKIIQKDSGKAFNPSLVDAFMSITNGMDGVRRKYQ